MYWIVKPGQSNERTVRTGYGKRERDERFCIPLKTIEAPLPFDQTDERVECVRWFERK